MPCRCGALDCKRCNPGGYWMYRDPEDHMLACECEDCEALRMENADRERERLIDDQLDNLDWQMEVRADDLRA